MSKSVAIDPALREKAERALVPFFVTPGVSTAEDALQIAASTLADYGPMTPKELQLCAQIIACSFAAMACLGAASVTLGKDIDIGLDLQESAIALHRLADRSTSALDARRKERAKAPHLMRPENTQWDNTAFQSTLAKATEKLLYAQSKLPEIYAAMAAATPEAAEDQAPAPVLPGIMTDAAFQALKPLTPTRH